MSDATKLPTSSELVFYQWSRKGAPNPKLGAPIDADDTTITFDKPLLDIASNVVTGAFSFGIRKSNGWVETCTCPAGGLSADGLTATGVIRGIDPGGLDWTEGNSDFADSHDAGEPVFCNIPAFLPEMFRSVLQGLIASGGSNFIIGTDASGTVTISRSTGTGTKAGFLRWYSSSNTAQFSNDGSTWTSFSDTAASVIFKATANDTTPSYAQDKIVAGSGITITLRNSGANEYLEISAPASALITTHETYTPAYLTGGSSAESNVALWDSISDGSWRQTINGMTYNFDGTNFTATHPDGIVTDMHGVAERIQSKIRSVTGGLETCTWETDHLLITSADTTSSSEVSVTSTSTGTVGTDISGAGASDWMDCDTGNGTETAGVLDPTADAGMGVGLNDDGLFNNEFMSNNLQEADTFFSSTDITGAEAETLTDDSEAGDLHYHAIKTGISTFSVTGNGQTKVIAHGLGRTPKLLTVQAILTNPNSVSDLGFSVGTFDGTTMNLLYTSESGTNLSVGTISGRILYVNCSFGLWHATVAMDATNITLTSAGYSTSGTVGFFWRVE